MRVSESGLQVQPGILTLISVTKSKLIIEHMIVIKTDAVGGKLVARRPGGAL